MRLKVSSAKWRPFCLGLNVLKWAGIFSSQKGGNSDETMKLANIGSGKIAYAEQNN